MVFDETLAFGFNDLFRFISLEKKNSLRNEIILQEVAAILKRICFVVVGGVFITIKYLDESY